MKRRKILIYTILIIFVAVIGLSGCRPANVDQLSEEDIQGLRDYVISSYYILKGDETLERSRATVPVHTDPQTSFSASSKVDYPEIGQNTTWIVADQGSGIYKVTAVTDYLNNDAIDYTEEIYYVKDADGNGAWDWNDTTVNPAGEVANLYREKFITVYKDKSIRYEEIQASSMDDTTIRYAAFEAPADATIPASESLVITIDEDAFFSSKVHYQQEVYKRFRFWNVLNKVIVGTRYYTETGDDYLNPVKTSISYERTITYEQKALGRIKQLLRAGVYEPDESNKTLAETVIWYKIDTDGTKEIVQKSNIINDFGNSFIISAEGGEAAISALQ